MIMCPVFRKQQQQQKQQQKDLSNGNSYKGQNR